MELVGRHASRDFGNPNLHVADSPAIHCHRLSIERKTSFKQTLISRDERNSDG